MTLAMIEKTEQAVQDFCGVDYHKKIVRDVTQYMKEQEEQKRRQIRS